MITIGIDSGTQSTKVICLDLEGGSVVAAAAASYGLSDGLPSGPLEQHPEWWTGALGQALDECMVQLGARRREVGAIAVSGQQHGLVALDAAGDVVRPAKLWCDTSSVPQCAEIEREFGGRGGLVELAGNAMLPGYTAPKILWLKQNEPDNFARLATILLPHDYLNHWLTGVAAMEPGDASGTALLDIRRRQWCQPLLRFIDPRLERMLPGLRPSASAIGELKPELARRWGLPAGVLVASGGGDNMMGAIGTGNLLPGRVTASFGTSGTLYAYADEPVVDPRGELAGFCDSSGGWLPLACTMNVTVATESARKLFALDLTDFEQAVRGAPPGADGLLMLPYLNGERTPDLPHGCGVLHGITTRNLTPANLARAALEGATLGLAYCLGRFREQGLAPAEIRLTGGGANSPAWRQIAADIFGVETVAPEAAEAAALGAALQAAWCRESDQPPRRRLAELAAAHVRLDEGTRCQPEPEAGAVYCDLIAQFNQLTTDLARGGHL